MAIEDIVVTQRNEKTLEDGTRMYENTTTCIVPPKEEDNQPCECVEEEKVAFIEAVKKNIAEEERKTPWYAKVALGLGSAAVIFGGIAAVAKNVINAKTLQSDDHI